MSGTEDNRNLTNAEVGMLISQNNELAGAVKEVAKGVSTLLQFQAAQTAMNEADRDWKNSVEKHQDKQDEQIVKQAEEFKEWIKEDFVPVRDANRDNSKMTNRIGIVSSLFIGSLITVAVMKYFGG